MGKKSREKKERKETGELRPYFESETPFISFCLFIVKFGVYAILFTPLIFSGKFFFPFVGPKSLYFMGLTQVIFFTWLFLILQTKKYRPTPNAVFYSLLLFLIIVVLSSIFGADFLNSFWSKFERMTGLLMMFHLFAFFLVISSVFKKESDWQKFFSVSIFVAVLISFLALMDWAGVTALRISDRRGATIGNTSFLGTYLLFNLFFAIYLIFKSRKGWRIYSLFCLAVIASALFFANPGSARAAKISFLGGLFLFFLFFLAFYSSKRWIKIIGRVLLAISFAALFVAFFLVFQEGNFINQKFVEMGTKSRVATAEIALKGFKEKPLLGWGPENFELAFFKYFDPKLHLGEYGGEVWFDRTHNIVFDTLVSIGIFGFLSYLLIFGALFYFLWKKYLREKTIDFWTVSIFSVIPISYFIQNITVFDMISSYLMFFFVLGFVASFAKKGPEGGQKIILQSHPILSLLILLAFFVSFIKYFILPLQADSLLIKAVNASTSEKRIELYKKTLAASPLGRYQIREFLAQTTQRNTQANFNQPNKEDIKKELDFMIEELEKTKKESPLDYKSILRLGQLYMLYGLIEPPGLQKFSLAENTFKQAISLFPNNQQGYWTFAQVKLYQGDIEQALLLAEKATELEPRLLNSHLIELQIAKLKEDKDLLKKKVDEAIKINPLWESDLKKFLES